MKIYRAATLATSIIGLAAGCAGTTPAKVAEDIVKPEAGNCTTMCDKYKECENKNFDADKCRTVCKDKSEKDDHYKLDVEHCADDVKGKSCSELSAKDRCWKAGAKTGAALVSS